MSKSKTISFCIENVDFDICIFSKNYHRIEFINSKFPRAGNGTRALNKVCLNADALNITLSLLPTGNTKRELLALKEWYARFGFVEYDEDMIRKPRNHG